MSFSLTVRQVEARVKDVTRRLGWLHLRPGDLVQPVVKARGLKKGERVEKIGGLIRIVSARLEQLDAITLEDVVREGFPGMTPVEFVAMFCQHNRCMPDRVINRIEFEYV